MSSCSDRVGIGEGLADVQLVELSGSRHVDTANIHRVK